MISLGMSIRERVEQVRRNIARAAERAGRSPQEIRILAATKGRSVAEILEAIRAGIDLIGENTIQEALSKFEFLPQELEKHMIGTLQRGKVKAAVRLFHLIESVNSLELAREIDRGVVKLGREKPYPVLVEVNPAGEETKRGVLLDEVKPLIEQIAHLKHVQVQGLMAMMPYDDPEKLRPYFRLMKELFDSLKGLRLENVEMRWLSMGMSHDYIVAVEEGANLVRLGTALFGPRKG
jgi:hypothetical protein